MRNVPRKKIPLSLELAPLVDVVLLLLVFFLLTFSLSIQNMQLDLPETNTADKGEEGIQIVIDKEGRISVDGADMNLNTLLPFLRLRVKEEKIKKVIIKADANVPLKIPVQVMDICRRAGAEGVSIATKKGGG